MSKERGLLNLCAVTFKARNICPLLLTEISELLAQPEQENLTPRQGLEEYKKGYYQAELDLKREPLSFEDLNIMWCGNPIDFARRIESIHGIGVDDENI
jgi:hypothetical protein